MPCYDPPPPYQAAAEASAEQAVKILCSIMGSLTKETVIDYLNHLLSVENLTWYLEHRKIDLQIAETGFYKTPDLVEARKIRLEIPKIEELLANAVRRRQEQGK